MRQQAIAKLKTNSANLITLANLSFGGFSILAIINEKPMLGLLFIFIAAFADRYDGKIARKFQAVSELGKQLDSMCDLISFGVAPAVLIYSTVLKELGTVGMVCTVFYIGCGAFRLARFNISECKGFFQGMPIPVAACICTFSYLFNHQLSSIFYLILMFSLSFVMVSTIKVRKL